MEEAAPASVSQSPLINEEPFATSNNAFLSPKTTAATAAVLAAGPPLHPRTCPRRPRLRRLHDPLLQGSPLRLVKGGQSPPGPPLPAPARWLCPRRRQLPSS